MPLWTASSLLAITLLLGSVTWFRHRFATRASLVPTTPNLRPVMPAFTACMGLLGLILVLVGLPHPRTVGGLTVFGLRVAVVTAALMPRDLPDDSVDTLVVELGHDDDLSEIAIPLLLHGASVRQPFSTTARVRDPDLSSTWVVQLPRRNTDELLQVLRADRENVAHAERDVPVAAAHTETAACEASRWTSPRTGDPLSATQQELELTGATTVIQALRGNLAAEPVTVAIIDTGVDGQHEDLVGVLASRLGARDPLGHGTAVAGALAAITDNGLGIASLNVGGQVLRLRSYDALAVRRSAVAVAEAIEDAVADGATVIVMSFGARGHPPEIVADVVGYAHRMDVALIVAAGNDVEVPARRQWPANIPGVLVVGGRGVYGRNTGAELAGTDRSTRAPASQVCLPAAGGGYERFSGTSFAAPQVAGQVALYRALCPRMSAAEAIDHVLQTESGGAARVDRGVQALATQPSCR